MTKLGFFSSKDEQDLSSKQTCRDGARSAEQKDEACVVVNASGGFGGYGSAANV